MATVQQSPATTPGPENRVQDAMLLFSDIEAKLFVDNPGLRTNDPALLARRESNLEGVIDSFRGRKKELSLEERATLKYLRSELKRTKAALNPTTYNKVRYFPPVRWLINTLKGNRKKYKAEKKHFDRVDTHAIKSRNFKNLKEGLQRAKLNVDLDQQIQRALDLNLKNFSFPTTDPQYPNVQFDLHFRKIENSHSYYMERFDIAHRPDLEAYVRNDPTLPVKSYSRTAALNFSAEEAYNLFQNRPVMQTHNGQNVWYTNDVTQANGVKAAAFDVEQEITRWPIKEQYTPERLTTLITALQQGKTRDVSIDLPNRKTLNARVSVATDLSGLQFHDFSGQLIDIHARLQGENPHLAKLLQHAQQQQQQPQQKPQYRVSL